MRKSVWWPLLGGAVGGGLAWVLAWSIAGADADHLGDWRNGALRFIGLVAALGAGVGYFGVSRWLRGAAVTRDGFTLSYRPLEAVASGYRELTTLTAADLLERLRGLGYEPVMTACDELGQRAGVGDPLVALVGMNIGLTDRRVRGWIRVQLPAPAERQVRAMGLVEVWTERGDSAEELALFTLRALGELVNGLAVKRESSQVSEDPVAVVTSGLGQRPRLAA